MVQAEADTPSKIQQLEKANRILKRQLEQAQADSAVWEENFAKQQTFLTQVIRDLTASQQVLEAREEELRCLNEELEDHVETRTAELRVSQARFQKLAENVPGMIYQFKLDIHGSVAIPYVSSGCRDIFGIDPEKFQRDDHRLFSLVHPEDQPGFQQSILRSAQTLMPWRWEGRMQHATGEFRWIQGISRPERSLEGDIVWDGLMMDISDRQKKTQALETALAELQQAQLQIIQSEKMSSLGQLVAGVAHEINNPVSFIYGNINYAREYAEQLLALIETYQTSYPTPPEVIQTQIDALDLPFLQEDLPKVFSSMQMGADRIKQIILSLRNFSRMDEAEFKQVNIHDGIDSTLVILEHRLKAQNNRPKIEVLKQYGNLPLVTCYAGQLNQVFMNLLSNAIDALEERCEKSSQITITTDVVDTDRVQVAIVDNGAGMSATVQERIFNPFYTTKAVGKGTGMGLSISYQIITEKHRGRIECHSIVGQGTEFVITIPVEQLSA